MSILRILHYPDPVLAKKAEPIKEITDDIRRLAEDMAETMKAFLEKRPPSFSGK